MGLFSSRSIPRASVLQITTLLLVLSILAAAYAILAYCLRGPEDSTLATFVRPLCHFYVRAVHRLRIFPPTDVVPRSGPAILVANHRSGVDPILIAILTQRRVRFLMAREYYEVYGLKWAFRSLGCIPVNRDGNDLGATKSALKALRHGEVIGIFPQGGIRDAKGSLEGKAGVALLSLRSGAPVVPFYIYGSRNLDSVGLSLITPSRTWVNCGVPLLFSASEAKPGRETLERTTAEILESITRLKPLLPKPDLAV